MNGQAVTYRPAAAAAQASALEQLEDDVDDEDGDDSEGELPVHLRDCADAPKPPPGAIHPSLGSELHDSAQCKRCCFFPRGRCTNGYNCEFCHYEHEKRKRKNKKKKKKDNAAVVLGAVVQQPASMVRMVGQG